MNEPEQPGQVLWRLLDSVTDPPDEMGTIMMHFHLKSLADSEVYLVSVSGNGHSPAKNFALAFQAAAQTIVNAANSKTESKLN